MSAIASGILSIGSSLVDKLFTSDEEKSKAKARLLELQQRGELAELEQAGKIIQAEANSEHWITAAWRPIIMLTFGAIIANNYILAPYLDMMFGAGLALEVPADLWDLLKIGLGGYVVGRSAEKCTKAYKGTK